MEKRLIFILIILFFISFINGSTLPALPHAFYGEIKCTDGNYINSGTIVAEINGTVKDSTQIISGKYGYTDNFIVTSTTIETIDFYLNGNLIGNYLFEPFAVTKLDFVINCSTGKPVTNPQELGLHSVDINWSQLCEPSWRCSAWSACNNGVQTRKCYDDNGCSYEYNKPIETMDCKQGTVKSSLIAENLSSIPVLFIILTLTFFILIVLIFLILIKANKKTNKRHNR